MNLKINPLAVLVSIVALHVLGFLWYGPGLGDAWLSAIGKDAAWEAANPPAMGAWISNTGGIVASVLMLAWLYTKIPVENAVNGLLIGAGVGTAFNLLPRMTTDFFAQNPYSLSWITGGYFIVAMALVGLILGAWRKYAD